MIFSADDRRRMSCGFLVLGLIVFFSAVSRGEPGSGAGLEGDCGKPKPIAGYRIEFQGNRISLPAHVIIKRNDSVIYADAKPREWEPPYTSAEYALWGDSLLILALYDDCVDIQNRRLFIIRGKGPVVHQPVWTSNWKGGFFVEDGALTYWSEWFCKPEDKEREAGKSYVYQLLKGNGAFQRVVVNESEYCARPPLSRLIKFRPLRQLPKSKGKGSPGK